MGLSWSSTEFASLLKGTQLSLGWIRPGIFVLFGETSGVGRSAIEEVTYTPFSVLIGYSEVLLERADYAREWPNEMAIGIFFMTI